MEMDLSALQAIRICDGAWFNEWSKLMNEGCLIVLLGQTLGSLLSFPFLSLPFLSLGAFGGMAFITGRTFETTKGCVYVE